MNLDMVVSVIICRDNELQKLDPEFVGAHVLECFPEGAGWSSLVKEISGTLRGGRGLRRIVAGGALTPLGFVSGIGSQIPGYGKEIEVPTRTGYSSVHESQTARFVARLCISPPARCAGSGS